MTNLEDFPSISLQDGGANVFFLYDMKRHWLIEMTKWEDGH